MKNRQAGLKSSYGEQGFALPIAVGVGLLMLMVGATMIVRSQADVNTANAQKATARGLSAAEIGIARYQSILVQTPEISLYPDCAGVDRTNLAAGTACTDGTTTQSWYNATQIKPAAFTCSSNSTTISTTTIQQNASTEWRNVDNTDPNKGQYRLVKYTYGPTPGVYPGTGVLTVEGRVDQSGSGSTATTDPATSTTRLQVNVPVGPESVFDNYPFPGVWVKSGGTDNNTHQANVFTNDTAVDVDPSDGSTQIKVTGTDVTTGLPNKACITTYTMPSPPPKPANIPNNLGAWTGTLLLPRSTDTATTETINGLSRKVYRYSASSINLQQGSATMTIRTGDYNPTSQVFNTGQTPVMVIIYLDGNIEKGGDVIHSCKNPPTSTGQAITNCNPTDFQIFGYAPASNPPPKICLTGNEIIEAFILAPNYVVGVAGSGGGAGGIKGTVWANSWNNGGGCGSNTQNTVVVQTSNWYEVANFGIPLPTAPRIARISTWQRQEVTP